MAPNQIKSMSLRSLRELRDTMMSTEYLDRLESEPAETKRRSAETLLTVQSAFLRLRNAELAAIRDTLTENEAALDAGRKALEHTLEDLDDLHAFLDDVGHFLNILGKIVSIVRP